MSSEDETGAGEPRRPDYPTRAREAFFGRLKGPKLRPHQAALLEDLLPRYRLDLPPQGEEVSTDRLFAAPVTELRLEIGFGGGEHLFADAARETGSGFIGAEPFVNGMAKMLAALDKTPLANLRLFQDDATQLLDRLPAASVSEIDLLYPDPWPKRRHWKRRFVSETNLDRMARVLKPGGLFRFASDIESYVDWTLLKTAAHPAFAWTARRAQDWHQPFPHWQGTRYEAKAIREGRRPAYLTFERMA
ncbi:tRNA (guanine(46)-N(7))-methyltransferase TrmB [Consotaella salsifontis]|uniref:tRNA (guanine-N(7)-)-methyltransferase n=1 Tax=Consotaella salsifontis TaxID=1365950 RepID=A0A1T4S6F8_9HYPH|nr:tRNA (guanosine(46)-N(7))-methyltransferase TrmB [Consotaella salsifontis]SKA23441.1 tRNA (guanine-N7-)-methyltransferase [Consotaella salsifontis]